MVEDDEPKPCPFCGGDNITIVVTGDEFDHFYFSCDDCLSEGPVKKGEAEAIAAWNRRATPPQTR